MLGVPKNRLRDALASFVFRRRHMQPNPSSNAIRKRSYLNRAALLAAVIVLLCGLIPVAAMTGESTLANQPVSEYSARRQKLMSQVKDGVIVLLGAREEDLGEVGRFRQKNDFMY